MKRTKAFYHILLLEYWLSIDSHLGENILNDFIHKLKSFRMFSPYDFDIWLSK